MKFNMNFSNIYRQILIYTKWLGKVKMSPAKLLVTSIKGPLINKGYNIDVLFPICKDFYKMLY